MSLAFWICAAITVVSAAVSFGYASSGLAAADTTARTPSMYAFARSIALLAVAVAALVVGSVPFLVAIAGAMVIVQAADAVIGGITRDRVTTVGPALTAVVGLASLIWLAIG